MRSAATTTTTELLEGLQDPANRTAWRTLDERMRPVVVAVARRLGLSADAAEEVAQQTLVDVFEGCRRGSYERGRGRLRAWIVSIAHHRAIDELRRHGRGRGALEAIPDIPDPVRLTEIWDEEWTQHLAREAMKVLRATSQIEERTVRAFELFALRGVPADDVAAQCAMPRAQVYLAKNRVTKRLREIVRDLARVYEEGL
jgi:RNA polymerase sigma-70 factor (ECF subfamily)